MSSPGSQPRDVLPVSVLPESELGSEAQRERRKRILDATLAIASKGGYEAVQMRAVADRADVAVGTLIRSRLGDEGRGADQGFRHRHGEFLLLGAVGEIA